MLYLGALGVYGGSTVFVFFVLFVVPSEPRNWTGCIKLRDLEGSMAAAAE
jgi:hypothetical protein